jgi:hypothetical protein
MGLDNIPNEYACQKAGTAVMMEHPDMKTGQPMKRLDCGSTQKAGGCPWHKVFGERKGRVYGMFGTDCWYRGKYGAQMLNAFGLDGERLYGDDFGNVSVDVCHMLADQMTEMFTNDEGVRDDTIMWEDENCADDWWYLADYLRWVALTSDGLNAWY